ncbi:MAG: hypothetical protein GY804_09580 [Alphaproteobacteria bacterium]|nr:hypothetical protein [Alphaproteobacteria bacterium]
MSAQEEEETGNRLFLVFYTKLNFLHFKLILKNLKTNKAKGMGGEFFRKTPVHRNILKYFDNLLR